MGSVPSIAARPQTRAVRVPAPVLLVAWLALATAIQLVRVPGLPAWRVIWAEDGTIFLQQALDHSLPHALGTTYAGYLHVVPRLLAEPAALVPPVAAAAVFAIGSALIVSLLAAYVWVASASLFETRRARALLVALFLLVPPTYLELVANAANLHWYGLVASYFALLRVPASRREAVVATTIVGLTALSDPLLALLLPVLFLRPGGLRRPQPGARMIPAAFVLGLTAQAVAILGATGPERQADFWLPELATIFAQRIAGPSLAGQTLSDELWLAAGWAWAWIALALLAALVIRAVTGAPGESRHHARLATAAAFVFFAIPLVIRGTGELAPVLGEVTGGGTRYFFAPMVLIWVPLLLLVDRNAVAGRIATLVVIVIAGSMTGVTSRSLGPDWPDSVSRAQGKCATGAGVSTQRIAPTGDAWFVSLPCDRL